MVLLAKHDRLPSRRFESRINAFGFSAHFIQKILVALDVRPARRPNLDKCEPLLKSGIQLEESFQCPEALENSFRVIHAIDSHSKERGLDVHLLTKRSPLLAGIA